MGKKSAKLNSLLGYECLDDGCEGTLLVTEKGALYAYNDKTIQVVTFKDDGDEVGKLVSNRDARSILRKWKVPSIKAQRELGLEHKLLV